MSFNSKNLNYELKQPSFLRKLRGEYDRGDSERHERPIARPKRLRDGADEDDEPTYVDEESNETVSKTDYEALVAQSVDSGKDEGKPNDDDDVDVAPPHDGTAVSSTEAVKKSSPTVEGLPKSKEQVADIGARSKRKAVKVVGVDDAEEPKGGNYEEKEETAPTKPVKGKKPRKKVKLSFDSGEDEA